MRRPMARRPASHLMETRWGPRGPPLRLVCGTLAGAAGSHCLQFLLPEGRPRAGAGRAEGTGCEDATGRTALGRLPSTAPMGRSPLGGQRLSPTHWAGIFWWGETAVGCVSCERVRSPWPSGVAPLCPTITPSVICPEPPGQKTGQFIGGAGPTSCLDVYSEESRPSRNPEVKCPLSRNPAAGSPRWLLSWAGHTQRKTPCDQDIQEA